MYEAQRSVMASSQLEEDGPLVSLQPVDGVNTPADMQPAAALGTVIIIIIIIITACHPSWRIGQQ